jgi:FkbM family methyltransferase
MSQFSNTLRSTVIDLVQSFFHSFGFNLNYYNPSNSEVALTNYLLSQFDIKTIVDVGANEGQFALKLIGKNNYKGTIISFEPVSSSFSILSKNSQKSSNWEVVKSAVGDTQGTVPINVSQNSVSSSLRKVNAHTVEAEAGTAIVNTEMSQLTPSTTYSKRVNGKMTYGSKLTYRDLKEKY